MVQQYYQSQRDRRRACSQVNAIDKKGGNHAMMDWLLDQSVSIERYIQSALGAYSSASPVGRWAQSIVGIGPVITAALLSHIDITRAPTAGHIWSFCGIHPGVKWEKGKRRPWCALMKVVAWKIGKSFVYFQNHPNDYYGKIFLARRQYEIEKNARGDYKDQALALAPRFSVDTQAFKEFYSQGRLANGHITNRAMRYSAKLFLAHLHEVWYREHFKVEPPKPYAIQFLGHAHHLPPPITGLVNADHEMEEE